jgi:glycosyltransferase involved in cell wall biosynthesis
MLLTIYIPTFNRGSRLEKSLKDVFNEIKDSKLESIVEVLVGDNASPDQTLSVCLNAKRTASLEGIKFAYFTNLENLGFSGNLAAGLERITSDWVMFLSDDDNLCAGSLEKLCHDLEAQRPAVALYNFSQTPFDFGNPLITREFTSNRNSDYSLLSTLVAWPKLTGIVLGMSLINSNPSQIRKICSFSPNFAHVVLSFFLFSQAHSIHKSTTFLAEPDEDFLDHVNYLPYIGQYLIEELKIYGSFFDPNNSTLGLVLNQIPRTNILEVSIDGLTGFYRGRVRLTKSVKDILSDNLLRFLMGKRETSDGLKYSRISFRSCLKLFLIPWFAVYSTSPKLLKVRHPLLMKEGF